MKSHSVDPSNLEKALHDATLNTNVVIDEHSNIILSICIAYVHDGKSFQDKTQRMMSFIAMQLYEYFLTSTPDARTADDADISNFVAKFASLGNGLKRAFRFHKLESEAEKIGQSIDAIINAYDNLLFMRESARMIMQDTDDNFNDGPDIEMFDVHSGKHCSCFNCTKNNAEDEAQGITACHTCEHSCKLHKCLGCTRWTCIHNPIKGCQSCGDIEASQYGFALCPECNSALCFCINCAENENVELRCIHCNTNLTTR